MNTDRPAEFLLVDVGNTTVKLRLARPARLLGRTRWLPTAALLGPGGAAAVAEVLAGWRYGRAALSCVVPGAAGAVAEVVPAGRLLRVSTALDTGVDVRRYPGKKTLGQDRLANLAGALARHGPGPLVVADFGTAATFNALDARGAFLGGTIAPGLAMVRDFLSARTAQLPPVRLDGAAPRAVGRSTAEALRAGALLGYRGLVREILRALRDELGSPHARVVATGGDARFLSARGWALFDAVDPDLTLHGLRVIAARAA